MDYGITIRTAAPSAGAVARVRGALRAQGFGVLTEIGVQATLRGKLGADMEPYLILGACNPSRGASGAQHRPQDRAAASLQRSDPGPRPTGP